MIHKLYKIFTVYIAAGSEGCLKKILLFPLTLLSYVYCFIVKIREMLYTKGILKKIHLPCTVISIGNIVIGGSGKTTVSILVADILSEMKKNVCVVCRSLSRYRIKEPQFVSIHGNILMDVESSGDEPYLVASYLRKGSVIVGKRKWESAEVALKRGVCDIIVLDDGFQHLKLHRDINILILTGDELKSYLFPRGVLRETPDSVARADVILINSTMDDPSDLRYYLNKNFPDKPLFTFSYRIKGILDPYSDRIIEPDFIRGKRIFLLSSIGNTKSFRKLMEKYGGIIEDHIQFPDHYVYKKGDIEKIIKKTNGFACFTTEKDWVKIKKYYSGQKGFFITMISIDMDPVFFSTLRRLIDGDKEKDQKNN